MEIIKIENLSFAYNNSDYNILEDINLENSYFPVYYNAWLYDNHTDPQEEVSLNLAYRWFCELDMMQKVPDHSTFSQNRRRRFRDGFEIFITRT